MKPRRLVLAMCAIVVAACGDAAKDVDYRGEPLFVIEGVAVLENDYLPVGDGEADGVEVVWGAPGVEVEARAAHVVTLSAERFRVLVYEPPPAAALRAMGGGHLAIAQLVGFRDRDGDGRRGPDEARIGASGWLLAFTPDGVDDGHTRLAAGFHVVRASGPCEVDPLTYIEVPADERARVVLGGTFDPRNIRFDPGCVARIVEWMPGELLPPVATCRWTCRFGPGAAFCDPCLTRAFPEGAPPEQCDGWLERSVFLGEAPFDSEAEWRLCMVGELPSPHPCDLACACAREHAWCLENTPEEVCIQKRASCDWR